MTPPRFHSESASPAFDLLKVKVLGGFLKWRHARSVMQLPLLLLSGVMVLHGLTGPTLAPKNLATTLTWVHFRGVLALAILAAGNLFCMACPFVLVRDLARRLRAPSLNWPRRLRNKWLSLALFALLLFSYELFGLWSSPFWTASLILLYFLGALAVDLVFKHASFCKFVCPLGQFNFLASTLSPFEVKVSDPAVCDSCLSKDCIRGRREGSGEAVTDRGCELALFLPQKVGNMDCTFCLDCVHACPKDNVGILSRLPGLELIDDPLRSGVGRLSWRHDLGALAALFTFGALVNAFAMVSPVYVVERWLSEAMHAGRGPVLGVLFGVFLLVEPTVLLFGAAWLTRRLTGAKEGLVPIAVRFSYALVPLGFGMWLAHYGFHFLTGFLTFIPVTQSALRDLGAELLGEPRWALAGVPVRFVGPIETGFILLGFLGSLFVGHGIAEERHASRPMAAVAPWALLSLLIALASLWLVTQPMEMRATFLSG